MPRVFGTALLWTARRGWLDTSIQTKVVVGCVGSTVVVVVVLGYDGSRLRW